MASFIITYDLKKPKRDYPSLHNGIKELSDTWARISDSTWIVADGDLTTAKIRDRIRSVIDSNDELFVGRLTGEAAWFGLSDKQSRWLKKNL